MSTIKFAAVCAVLLALVGALWGVYASGEHAGEAAVQARWDKARAEAVQAQANQVDKAAGDMVREVEVIRTVYRDRIKEVTRYVPAPGSNCPADPDFIRLFNDAAR